MPEYKLVYFPVRGKAELIRYALHQAGVPFEDCHVTKDEWGEQKADAPFGQAPVFFIDGKPMAQSLAIARYVANEHGLTGSNNMESAVCDMYVDAITGDFFTAFKAVIIPLAMRGDKAESDAEYAKLKPAELKTFLDRFEKFLADNGKGFLVGSKLTWADLALAEITQRLVTCFDKEALAGHPLTEKHSQMVHELPNIKKYVEGRKPMSF